MHTRPLRSFLALSMCLLLASCGGGGKSGTSASPTAPTPTATTVTQTLQILSSDGTSLGSATFDGTTNVPMTITVQNLKDKGIDTSSLNTNYFALREANQGDKLGAFVANTSTGTLTFTPSNSTRVIWGMSNKNRADYDGGWIGTGFNRGALGKTLVLNRRAYKLARLTKAIAGDPDLTVDEDRDVGPGLAAIRMLLDEVFTVANVKLVDFSWEDSDVTSTFFIGFAQHATSPTASGNHSVVRPFFATASPRISNNAAYHLIAGETMEGIFFYDNPFGAAGTAFLFGFTTDLNARINPVLATSRDLLRFSALMPQP